MCSKDFEIRPKLWISPKYLTFSVYFGNSRLLASSQTFSHCGKCKINYFCKLRSPKRKVFDGRSNFEKKIPNDIWTPKVKKREKIVNPKKIPKITESKLGNTFHTLQLYTAKCTDTCL